MRAFLCLILLVVSFSVPVLAAAQEVPAASEIATSAEFSRVMRAIRAAEPAEAEQMAAALYGELAAAGRIPLVLQGAVEFLYYGDAESIEWRGDFNQWETLSPETEGRRVGDTNLWRMTYNFPADARVEYKIVRDGDEWLLDPANPNQVANGNINSELRMPDFEVSYETDYRQGIAHGAFEETQVFDSPTLGYPVEYEVYLPHGYETMDALPVLYVLDGNDFSDPNRAALPHALDNLIADGRIEPLIAVFIGARDPDDPEFNRREIELKENPEYAQFVATELVAQIDSHYRTDPARRHLMGVSFGGLGTAYIGTQYPDVFQNLTLFSPSFWAADATFETFDSMTTLPDWNVFVYWGQPGWDGDDLSDWIVGGLQAVGIEAMGVHTAEGHSWASWRGVTDEMLEYFYGTDT